MSTTMSMWLGILFLGLVIAAVLLQAWLWGPQFWDEQAKKTRAPKFWLRVHALCGYLYALIYVVMMWNMLPRLWEYQYELPARTVFHAVVGITIGVLLLTKITILLFFRHFEESMPYFGFGLLLCTVILSVLSIPYALQAHDLSGRTADPENVERVHRLLSEMKFEADVDVDQLVTPAGFARGRQLLVKKCTPCHDMRTILVKPRTAQGWLDVSQRMIDKPNVFGEQLAPADIPWVTAYLTAITPEIQESVKQRRAAERADEKAVDAIAQMVHEGEPAAAAPVPEAKGEELLQMHCTQCHELDEVTAHGGDDEAGWRSVVAAMVDEGAEYDDATAMQIVAYLAEKYPAKGDPNPPMPPARKDEEDHVDTGPAKVAKAEPAPVDAEPTEAKAEPAEAKAEPAEAKAEPAEAKAEPAEARKPRAGRPKAETEPSGDTSDAEPAKPAKPAKPKADAANGRTIFLAKCKTCHAADGSGDTPFGQKLNVPSLAKTSLSKGAVRGKIADGVSGTKMKGYGDTLSAQELDDLTAFVKRL